MIDRYSRQINFPEIGKAGQQTAELVIYVTPRFMLLDGG